MKDILNYLILNSYYHKQVNFTYELLDQNQTAYLKLINKISNIEKNGELDASLFEKYDDKFKSYLENDINTSNAITLLYDLLKDDSVNGKTKLELIESWDKVFSLNLIETKKIDRELEEKINALIEERNKYKQEKNYEKADEVRNQIENLGVQIKDTREGTIIVW